MPKVSANGVSLYYQRLGSGRPTVVFAHGLVMDNLSSWWYTVANAVAMETDVVCYDLRGHGLSERTETGYAVPDSVDDLLALLDALGITEPVVLVGNSYGGVVALAAAVRAPERVCGMVLLEAHAAVDDAQASSATALATGLDLAGIFLSGEEVDEWLDEFGGRKLNRMATAARALLYDTTLADDLRDSKHFSVDELAAIDCPVLLVFGEHSDIFDRAEMLERVLPRATLHVVAGEDHSILMGATKEIRSLVVDFVGARRAELAAR